MYGHHEAAFPAAVSLDVAKFNVSSDSSIKDRLSGPGFMDDYTF